MRLVFSKYEGLGNDFVVTETSVDAKQAVAICDRHRGVGADGVLIVGKKGDRFSMTVINADGSQPEMCGNGIRCVALFLVENKKTQATDFEIDTDAGPHRCVVRGGTVEVTMRAPTLVPASVPVVADAPVLDQSFEAEGIDASRGAAFGTPRSVKLTCVSMGNPHGVTFDDIGEARRTLGPALEKHARFPRHANIGFARVVAPQTIDLAVWERGVGFTEACGTGACACAVAAVETGRAERSQPIEVRLPGGPLQIRVGAPGERLLMTGPARHVFDGSVDV
ncbi:MAG TPA: diaminopimelate epimerase [Polyangiales bacterium]|nr:diaminopimelate epimerase [Polyangiales bacterium]